MKYIAALALWMISITTIAQVNIALNKPVTPSTFRTSTTLFPELITDGKTNTRWASENKDNEWIMVDLLAKSAITGIRIHWHTDYATKYLIEGSLDGREWFSLFNQTASLGSIENIPVATTARFIRINLYTRSRTYGFSIWELMVFGTELEPKSSYASSSRAASSSAKSSIRSSSSIAASASSAQSSSSAPPVPIRVSLSWKAPVKRENGEAMTINEVGGYEITSFVGQHKVNTIVINDGKVLTKTLDTQSNVTFKIAAFDTNGLYSQFVVLNPTILKGPSKVRNLRLLIQ